MNFVLSKIQNNGNNLSELKLHTFPPPCKHNIYYLYVVFGLCDVKTEKSQRLLVMSSLFLSEFQQLFLVCLLPLFGIVKIFLELGMVGFYVQFAAEV